MALYCLDTNALIEPWNKYYSMKLCPTYWNELDALAKKGIIFCPDEVRREIQKVDDELSAWIKTRPYLFREIDDNVMDRVRIVLGRYPHLVNTIKDRSMADPWVVAHAMAENAIVVTKEMPSKGKANRVRIPDVCDGFKLQWMDDYRFVEASGIRFTASRSTMS